MTAVFKVAGTNKTRSVSRPISRVLSTPLRTLCGHSSGPGLAPRFTQPTRPLSPARQADPSKGAAVLFGLAPGGACRAASLAGRAVGSYPTVSPLPVTPAEQKSGKASIGGLVLCGAIPQVSLGGRYPPPCLGGARTFLPHGLSALVRAAAQPTDAKDL